MIQVPGGERKWFPLYHQVTVCKTAPAYFYFDMDMVLQLVPHNFSLSPELLAILVGCDVPLHVQTHLAVLGVVSVAKFAYCVCSDKELLDEILGSMGDLLHLFLCIFPMSIPV